MSPLDRSIGEVAWRRSAGRQRPAAATAHPLYAGRSLMTLGALLGIVACDGPPRTSAAGDSTTVASPAVPAAPGGGDTLQTVSGSATRASGEPDLVDPSIAPAIAGEGGWNYVQTATVDLDGDGGPERIVLTARVEVYRGRPAWDDGQPWQVYVEEEDRTRTYVYARYVQLGTVTLRIGVSEGASPASVVLLEHLPDRLSLYEVVYRGPGSTSTLTRFQRTVDPSGDTASPALP